MSLPSTTITSLALEQLEQILEEVATGDSASVYRSSLVCRDWREPSLKQLYRSVRITSEKQLKGLSTSPALPRYPTSSLKIVIQSDVVGRDLVYDRVDYESIIDGCEGLGELHMEGHSISTDLVDPLLGRPALSALQTLTLKRIHTSRSTPTLLYRLHFSSIDSTSPAPPDETLSTLDLSGERSDQSFLGLERVLLSASRLRTLSLPPIDLDPIFGFPDPAEDVASFIKRATSLRTLEINTDNRSTTSSIVNALSLVLTAVTSPLTTFTFNCPPDILSAELIDLLLQNVVEAGAALSLLRELRFSGVTLKDLKANKGGANFVELFGGAGKILSCSKPSVDGKA